MLAIPLWSYLTNGKNLRLPQPHTKQPSLSDGNISGYRPVALWEITIAGQSEIWKQRNVSEGQGCNNTYNDVLSKSLFPTGQLFIVT